MSVIKRDQETRVRSDIGRYGIVPEWLLDAGLSARAIHVFAILAAKYSDDGIAYPSRRRLRKDMGDVSLDTVDRAIDELTDRGAISVLPRRSDDGDPTSNEYTLHFVRGAQGLLRLPIGGRTDAATPGHGSGDGGRTHAATVAAPMRPYPETSYPEPTEPELSRAPRAAGSSEQNERPARSGGYPEINTRRAVLTDRTPERAREPGSDGTRSAGGERSSVAEIPTKLPTTAQIKREQHRFGKEAERVWLETTARVGSPYTDRGALRIVHEHAIAATRWATEPQILTAIRRRMDPKSTPRRIEEWARLEVGEADERDHRDREMADRAATDARLRAEPIDPAVLEQLKGAARAMRMAGVPS